ncbi:MAG: hypothetical protein ACNA7O_04155 [Rhodobacterales bacterium]
MSRKVGGSFLRAVAIAIAISMGAAAPVRAAPDAADAERPVHAAPAAGDESIAPRRAPLPSLRREMARYSQHSFMENRQRLTQALYELREKLSHAIRPSPVEIDLLLDLAALHLSQRMLPEAQSFLDALPAAIAHPRGQGHAWLSPVQERRKIVLAAALTGFSGAEGAAPGDWPDAPLFDALGHIAGGDFTAARPLLAKAAEIVAGYPAALAEPVVPQLLLAAIEGGAWDVARDLAERLRPDEGSRHGAAYHHLLGRAAEIGGDLVAAFDNHAAAAAGSDEWAQRSRLALVDLGRTTGTLPPADARVLLHQTRAIWAGGPLGLATLQRIAGLELATRRELPALEVLADIIRLHPDTREAVAAKQQALALIDAIHTLGLAGDMTLVDFIAAHRAIARNYRFNPDFDRFAEAYADHLAASGASGLAAAAFDDLRTRIAGREGPAADPALSVDPAGDVSVEPDPVPDRLRLKHAAALMQGGLVAEAEALLSAPLDTSDSAMRDAYNLMRAQLFAVTARHADVLGTHMAAPSAEYLRLRAEAAFALAEWHVAHEAYERLFRVVGQGLQAGDRINLLLAAHRSGDPERLRALLRNFPDLGAQWAALAAGLTTDAPDVLPLRGDAAQERVENAGSAVRLLQAAGGDDMP